jgi:hypothetical protein
MTPEPPEIHPGAIIASQLLIAYREILRDELHAKHGADFWRYEPLNHPAGASEAVRTRYIKKHGRWPFGDPQP